tara:strand:- start:225 stop:596 length:372 start_codon:yes stop_codon:yes gene_type:complete
MSIASKNKLKSSKAIDLLFSKGKHLKTSGFSLVYTKQKEKNPAGILVGFSVSKKNQLLAVERNKTKRIMRSAFVSCCSDFFSAGSFFYNVMFVCNCSAPPSFSVAKEKIKFLLLSFNDSISSS